MSTPPRQDPSCQDDNDPSSLRIEQAWARIRTDIAPIKGTERVATRDALSRILAEDIHSRVNVPSTTNAAMDGYAIRGDDLQADGSARLEMLGKALAGHPYSGQVTAGGCVRITTGASMPAGADTVVMQERATVDGGTVIIDAGQELGQNVRQAGEDLALGQRVLAAGQRVDVPELGILGSMGLVEVSVRRRLRVAFFSTGDELIGAGEPAGEGKIYDSNRYTLFAALQALGVEATDMGVVGDSPEALEQAFTEAASFADAIITSGGVSVGEADYIKQILNKLGSVNFWKIAMRPGRPLAFGRLRDAWFFGLPGNPVSVVATWYQFVQPALRHLSGQEITPPLRFRVRTADRLRKRPGRTEFQRGILRQDDSGELVVHTTGSQGSGILSSMSAANCFIVVPHDSGPVAAGEYVEVQPFHGVMG